MLSISGSYIALNIAHYSILRLFQKVGTSLFIYKTRSDDILAFTFFFCKNLLDKEMGQEQKGYIYMARVEEKKFCLSFDLYDAASGRMEDKCSFSYFFS